MRILIIIAILVVSFACKKETTISGRVYNPSTNVGMEHVTILVTKEKIDPVPLSWYGAGTKGFITESNSDGNYVLPIKSNKKELYYLYFLFDDELYFTIESKRKFLGSLESNQEINYSLLAPALIMTRVKNTACFDTNDKIEVYTSVDYGEQATNNLACSFNGCVDDTSSFRKISSGNRYYHWVVTKNSITTHHYDTITLAPYEQRYYEIFY